MTDAPELLEAGDSTQPLHVYEPIRRPQNFLWLLTVPVPLVMAALVLLIGGDALFIILGLMVALASAIVPAAAYYLAIMNNDLRIEIFSDRISHFKNGQRTEIFWRELKDVRIASYRTPRKGFFIGVTEVSLLGIDNKAVVVGAFVKDSDLLVTVISEVIRMYQMPEMVERLRAGEQVSFGAVQLSAEGMHAAGRTLSWEKLAYDLLETGASRYRVIAYGSRPLDLHVWFTVRLRDLQNIPLLMALVNHYDQFSDAESTLAGTPSMAQLAAESAYSH